MCFPLCSGHRYGLPVRATVSGPCVRIGLKCRCGYGRSAVRGRWGWRLNTQAGDDLSGIARRRLVVVAVESSYRSVANRRERGRHRSRFSTAAWSAGFS